MDHSRGNFHSTNEDPTPRSNEKKNVTSGESSQSSSAEVVSAGHPNSTNSSEAAANKKA
ncbi:unnamed protein product [Dovyalis caffra]|uniref:Uncharacterized protein n=1 Tax=Dovyalis caffra TaxID=77055 RepID=A0AAV1QVR7_9ROSI|nr:unnamed protein product [Dovyalis caffra]